MQASGLVSRHYADKVLHKLQQGRYTVLEQQAGCPVVSLSVNELLWNANILRDRPSHKRIQVSALVVLLWMLLACLASWPGCSASSLYMAM